MVAILLLFSVLVFWSQGMGDLSSPSRDHTCNPCVCVCVLSCFSCVQLFVTLWTVSHQAPLSVGFSRHEYWSGLPHPPPWDLPIPGIEPTSLMSPALAGRFFTTSTAWEDPCIGWQSLNHLTPTEVPELSLEGKCVLGEGTQVSFPPLLHHYPKS